MSQDLFKKINATIRKERLYADIDLMREDIMRRFGIGRHRLNDLLSAYADGMSFPQYINAIRMEEAYILLTDHPEMTIAEVARQVGFTAPNLREQLVARQVGFTAPNLREQFKRCYGITPVEYRAGLVSDVDD